MANPWLQFVSGREEEEPENPWLAFAQQGPELTPPEERLREMRERYPGAPPGLNEPGEEQEEQGFFDRASDYQAARRRSFGTNLKRNLWDLTQIPETVLRGSAAAKRAILPEALEGPATQQEELGLRAVDALTPDFVREGRERAAREAEEAKVAKAEAGMELGLPDAAQAAENFAEDFTAMALDPLELLPGGLAAGATGRAVRRGGRAAERAAPVADEALETLARASQEIGSSLPSVQKAARVVDATPEGSGAIRRLRTLDEGGNIIGDMTFTLEPGGGFRVMDVETVGRGTGGMRAMMERAQTLADGPYMGSLAETDEGAAALARLQETNPQLFSRAPVAEPAGPAVHLPAGERGHVRVPVGAEEGSPTFYRRWFTEWGDYAAMGDQLGPATAEAKRLTGSAIKTEGKRAEMVVRDASLQVKRYHKALPGDRELDETLEYVLSGLEGEHAFEGAEGLGDAMRAAREHLDTLSRDFEGELQKLIEGDLIKSPEWQKRAKELRGIIKGNTGKWTRRSFQAFRNADWADLVKAPDSAERWRWDNFMEWAKREISSAEPGLADDVLQARAEGLGNKYLRRDPEVFLGFGERTLIPTEKLGSARARLNLPQQIDDLLGLDTDPLVRYRESVLSLAHDIESLRFKRKLLEEGEGRIFFDQPTGNFSEAVRGASGLDPLAGRYTSPEIHAVIAAATSGARDAATLLAKTSSLVKAGKTVFSPFVTHPRNLFSWIPMITATGNTVKAFNPRRWARSAAVVASGKVAKGGKLERSLDAVARHVQLADGRRLSDVKDYTALEYLRERLLKLQKAGVVGESTTAGDVGHYLGVTGSVKSLNALKDTPLAKGAGKFSRAMQWMYGAEDDLGKMVAFDALEEDLRWAMQGADPDEVFGEAARRIRDTTPTYSKIAPATRKLRDSPILSAFPTFTQEVYRNFKNGAKLALKDLRDPNPRMRLLGAKRLGGLVTAAGAPGTIAAAASYATGISDEGVEALREFVAPWDRSAHLAPVSVDGYKIQTVNLSYMMPHAILTEPLIASALQVAQGEGPVEDVVEAAFSAAWEAGEPFLSREILLDGILDFAWKTRGEFWDPKKEADVNARAVANAIWRTVTPGGLLWIERVARASGAGEALEEGAASMEEGPSKAAVEFIGSLLQQANEYGKDYKLGEELTAGVSGIRSMTYDLHEGLGFKARAFKRNSSDASYHKNKAKRHAGGLPPGTILERRREANEQFRKGWLEMHRAVEAMRKIGEETGKSRGVVDRDIRRKLEEEKVGQKWIRSLLYGRYEDPY